MKKRTPFTLEWTAPEHEHKERSADWFWAMGIITISIAVASVIFGNIIFALLVVVSVFCLALFINRKPEEIHMRIDENGILRGNLYYPYDSLASFWLETEHSHPKILLRSKKFFLPLIIIPLGHEAPEEKIIEALSENLTEEHHSLPLVERLLEYLGF